MLIKGQHIIVSELTEEEFFALVPPMMGGDVQTLTAADAILKDMYVGPVIEQLNYQTYMLDQIRRDSDSIDHTGRRAVIPLRFGRNRGRGSRGATSPVLPVAGKQVYEDAIVNIRYHYAGIEIDDSAIQATMKDEGAFINLLDDETDGVANDLKKDINRQVFGDGTGALTTVRANSTSTTVNVNSVQYIQIGDPVDVLVSATGAVTNGVAGTEVTDTDATAGAQTITIADALAGTAGTTYAVYIAGSYGNEMDGLQNIVSKDRTLHGIDSTTAANKPWNAHEIDISDAVADENSFIKLAQKVNRTGQGKVDVFLTTSGIQRRLAGSYQSQKRWVDAKAVEIHGGYTSIFVNEYPVITDDDCPAKQAFGINKKSLAWFQQKGPDWLKQRDTSVFHLKDHTTAGQKVASWQAWFCWYAALGCKAPNRNGRLINCEDDSYSDLDFE